MKRYPLIALLLIGSVFFGCGPTEEQIQKVAAEKLRIAQEKIEVHQAEELRIVTLTNYKTTAEELYGKNQISKAIIYLDSTLNIAHEQEKQEVLALKAEYCFKVKKYDEAAQIHTELISQNTSLSANYYQRALCYEKLKKRQEAVNDLRKAQSLGSSDAKMLFEKINPIRKKVSHYVTRCCDGSNSNAKGRGACSQHGGVCNWNAPVYVEYREY